MTEWYWTPTSDGSPVKHLVINRQDGRDFTACRSAVQTLDVDMSEFVPCPGCIERLMDAEAEGLGLDPL